MNKQSSTTGSGFLFIIHFFAQLFINQNIGGGCSGVVILVFEEAAVDVLSAYFSSIKIKEKRGRK